MRTDIGLGERLRKARQGARLSQRVVAKAILSVPHLSMAERGRRGLSARALLELSERLPVSFRELLPPRLDPEDAAELLSAAERLCRGGENSRAAVVLQGLADALPLERVDLRARCLIALGYVWTRLQQFHLAEKSLQEGLHLAERIGDPRLVGDAYLKIGGFHLYQSQLREGLDALKQALAVLHAQRRPQLGDLGSVLHNIGYAHVHLGEPMEALSVFAEAAEVADRTKDHALAGAVARNSASAWMALHRYDEALAQLRIARDRYLKAERMDRLANVENGLGFLLLKTGRPAEAIEPLRRSVSLAERVGDVRLQAQSLTELARAHVQLKHYDEAYPIAAEAIRLARKSRDDVEVARADALQAEVLAHRGQLAQAEAALQLAVVVFEQREQRADLTGACEMLGTVLERQERHEEASEFLRRALELARAAT